MMTHDASRGGWVCKRSRSIPANAAPTGLVLNPRMPVTSRAGAADILWSQHLCFRATKTSTPELEICRHYRAVVGSEQGGAGTFGFHCNEGISAVIRSRPAVPCGVFSMHVDRRVPSTQYGCMEYGCGKLSLDPKLERPAEHGVK